MATERFAIRRRIEIDAAHRVPHHKSKCFNIHGHRYVIEAVVAGELFKGSEQDGMVMDFGFLKECMMECIYNPCDHGMIFCIYDPVFKKLPIPYDSNPTYKLRQANFYDAMPGWKIYLIDESPTAENLAKIWYEELGKTIAKYFHKNFPHLTLADIPEVEQVIVWETPNCQAIYPFVDPKAEAVKASGMRINTMDDHGDTRIVP